MVIGHVRAVRGGRQQPARDVALLVVARGDLLLLAQDQLARRHHIVEHRGRGDHRGVADADAVGGELAIVAERHGVDRLGEADHLLLAGIAAQAQVGQAVRALRQHHEPLEAADAEQVVVVVAGDLLAPVRLARRVLRRADQPEVLVPVVGQDPQPAMRVVEAVAMAVAARGDQAQRRGRASRASSRWTSRVTWVPVAIRRKRRLRVLAIETKKAGSSSS